MTEQDIQKLKQSLGNSSKPLFVAQFCRKCKSTKKIANHHITYIPEKTAPLCSHCHAKITVLNTVTSIVTGTNKENDLEQCNINRKKVWSWFLRKRRTISISDVLDFLCVDYDFTDEQIDYITYSGARCL